MVGTQDMGGDETEAPERLGIVTDCQLAVADQLNATAAVSPPDVVLLLGTYQGTHSTTKVSHIRVKTGVRTLTPSGAVTKKALPITRSRLRNLHVHNHPFPK